MQEGVVVVVDLLRLDRQDEWSVYPSGGRVVGMGEYGWLVGWAWGGSWSGSRAKKVVF